MHSVDYAERVQTCQQLSRFLLLLQYMELSFTIYEGYIPYAAILLFITVASGFAATSGLYSKRLALYDSVQQRHLVPMVIGGIVR